MELKYEFKRILIETNKIALATSVNNIPNVRVVNFCEIPEKKGIIYFASFRGLPKTMEISQNDIVAFTTIPISEESAEHVRVNNATVKKSELTIYDLKDQFIKKIPSYEEIIAHAGDMLDVYEISFNEASVQLGPGNGGKIKL